MCQEEEQHHYQWVASLYFAQGLPFVAVVLLSTIFYKDLGFSNLSIASITSLFFLPWIVKPIFAPCIESAYTKRQWTLFTEACMMVLFFLLCLSLSFSSFFDISVVLFFALAFFSSLHDIGSDGVYLLTLSIDQQHHYVGLRNCAYQAAKFFGQGVLVVIAGWLILKSNPYTAWRVIFLILSLIMLLIVYVHRYSLPTSEVRDQTGLSLKSSLSTARSIFNEWFGIPQVILVTTFVLIYNATDAQLNRIVPLFFMDSKAHHGLSMSTMAMGVTQGVGVFFFIVGAFALSVGLKKISLKNILRGATVLLFMCNSSYLGLALFPKHSMVITLIIYGVAQLVFGFCNSAYMAFLMQESSHQRYPAACYALMTALMSLCFLIFGVLAGPLEYYLNYSLFFLWIIFSGAIVSVFTFYFTARCVRAS